MPDSPLREVLQDSMAEVLEKMFFIRDFGEAQDTEPGDGVTAHVTFEGDPPGCLTLRVTAPAARSIAADFLGVEEDELGEPEIGEVVCELANMICGSVLSRVESTTTFRLASPRIIRATDGPAPCLAGERAGTAAMHVVETSSGAMAVTFQMETVACHSVEKSAS